MFVADGELVLLPHKRKGEQHDGDGNQTEDFAHVEIRTLAKRLRRSALRRPPLQFHQLDWRWYQLLFWDQQSKFGHNGRTHHGDGHFYS